MKGLDLSPYVVKDPSSTVNAAAGASDKPLRGKAAVAAAAAPNRAAARTRAAVAEVAATDGIFPTEAEAVVAPRKGDGVAAGMLPSTTKLSPTEGSVASRARATSDRTSYARPNGFADEKERIPTSAMVTTPAAMTDVQGRHPPSLLNVRQPSQDALGKVVDGAGAGRVMDGADENRREGENGSGLPPATIEAGMVDGVDGVDGVRCSGVIGANVRRRGWL